MNIPTDHAPQGVAVEAGPVPGLPVREPDEEEDGDEPSKERRRKRRSGVRSQRRAINIEIPNMLANLV